MVAWEDVGESSSCLPQMCRQWMSAERNCTCTTTRPSGFLNAKHAIILSPPLGKRWVLHFHPALCRLHRYMGYCIEDTQISESVSTSGSAISKAASTGGGHLFLFFTHVLSPLFFWSTLLLSPAELISWKWEEERLWCPLLSHSAPRGPDWPLSEAPDTVPTWFSQPPTSQSPPCLC